MHTESMEFLSKCFFQNEGKMADLYTVLPGSESEMLSHAASVL